MNIKLNETHHFSDVKIFFVSYFIAQKRCETIISILYKQISSPVAGKYQKQMTVYTALNELFCEVFI